MSQFSKTDTRRITFLSLLGSAAQFAEDPYSQATEWLGQMEADGFFDSGVGGNPSSQGRSGSSARQGSPSRSGNRGDSRPRGRDQGGYKGGPMRDPNGPPTKSQIGKLLSLTEDYTWDEAEQMSKAEVSSLIDDLLNS